MEFLKQFLSSILPLLIVVAIPFAAVMIYRLIRNKVRRSKGKVSVNPEVVDVKQVLNSEKVIWKWKPRRWWLALLIFWLFCTIGASLVVRSGQPKAASGFIIATMLAFIIMCVSKDRGLKTLSRIFYVISAWIIHAILTFPIGLAVLKGYLPVAPHLGGRLITLLAAFPIVIYSMRRSTFFVKPIEKKTSRAYN